MIAHLKEGGINFIVPKYDELKRSRSNEHTKMNNKMNPFAGPSYTVKYISPALCKNGLTQS